MPVCLLNSTIAHQAAAAAVVLLGIAVHQLLLAERDQLACHDRVDALNRACGAERPAGATLQELREGGHRQQQLKTVESTAAISAGACSKSWDGIL